MSTPRLEIRALSKRYASPVLVDVDLDLQPGEVHALVGTNGAGKSTLARIIGGLAAADAGRMRLDGREHVPSTKRDAERAGVRMVLQELNLLGTLSVAENIFFDHLPRRFGFIDHDRLHAGAEPLLAAVGLSDLHPATPVGQLGIAKQQMVEIAAALSGPCGLLILDEPTSALTTPEIDRLFGQIARLRADGTSILYISHRLEEIRSIADRVTVLRDGRPIATERVVDLPLDRMIEQMIGGETVEHDVQRRPPVGDVALRVDGLCRGSAVRDVSFEVRYGEILGLAGLVGSGRTETLRALFGADPADAGQVWLGTTERRGGFAGPREAVRAGVGFVPEDRKQLGILGPQPIRVNTTLATLDEVTGAGGWIRVDRERRVSARLCDALEVQRVSVDQPVVELSGGNQQKVLMCRWLMRDCDVMLLDEPTRGVDVAAKQAMYRLLTDWTGRGKALVVVSSELPELTAICDRIAVLSAGRLVETFERGAWTEAAIMEAAISGYLDASDRTS